MSSKQAYATVFADSIGIGVQTGDGNVENVPVIVLEEEEDEYKTAWIMKYFYGLKPIVTWQSKSSVTFYPWRED